MTDVTLPSLGESVTEGIITQWFKKVGDTVARDEPLDQLAAEERAGVLVVEERVELDLEVGDESRHISPPRWERPERGPVRPGPGRPGAGGGPAR